MISNILVFFISKLIKRKKMSLLVKITINPFMETHFVYRVLKNKSYLTIVLNKEEEKFVYFEHLKTLNVKDKNINFCLKHWPKILQNDPLFQRTLMNALKEDF